MNPFTRENGVLKIENVALATIAERFGTPCYVYSRAALEASFAEFTTELEGLDALVCYAVKANGNLGVLNVFARLGAGFDIVSGGELQRVITAGGDPRKIVFSGVGKTAAEIEQALAAGILCFNVESAPELERVNEVAARLGRRAPVSLRVNPDVDAKTHPYISTGLKENKFGVAFDEARALYRRAAALPGLEIKGIDCHIGSQLLDPAPFAEALERVLTLVDALAADGIQLSHIDLGGGLGIRYKDETPPSVAAYLRPLLAKLAGRGLKVLLEPGRRLVGEAGALLTRVEYLKPGEAKNFAIVDAAMNDLARPALYEAWHDIVPLRERSDVAARQWDVVGPVCESGDFLGRGRELAVQAGDLLALLSAGAYGMSMSSNYNSRPRAAEVIVDGSELHLVRRRETIADLYAGESVLES
jgi:diaminopimelate decarboxylase